MVGGFEPLALVEGKWNPLIFKPIQTTNEKEADESVQGKPKSS